MAIIRSFLDRLRAVAVADSDVVMVGGEAAETAPAVPPPAPLVDDDD